MTLQAGSKRACSPTALRRGSVAILKRTLHTRASNSHTLVPEAFKDPMTLLTRQLYDLHRHRLARPDLPLAK